MKIDIKKFLDKVASDNQEEVDKASNSIGMLQVLNAPGYNMYAGTVPEATVKKRRAKNKVARRSRKVNRVR